MEVNPGRRIATSTSIESELLEIARRDTIGFEYRR